MKYREAGTFGPMAQEKARIQIRCPWDQFPSMHDGQPAFGHDLRQAAAMLLGEARGDHERASQLLRELTAPREQIDIPNE